MFCNKCGTEIPEGGKFCRNCGSPAAAPTAPQPEMIPGAEYQNPNQNPYPNPNLNPYPNPYPNQNLYPNPYPNQNMYPNQNTKSSKSILKIVGSVLLIVAAALFVWAFVFDGKDYIASKSDKLFECDDFTVKMDATMEESDVDKPNLRAFENYNKRVGAFIYKETTDMEITQAVFDGWCNSQTMNQVFLPKNYKEISVDGDIITFTYDETNVSNPNKGCFGYARMMYKGKDFYLFIFACEPDKKDEYEKRFEKWADSIELT